MIVKIPTAVFDLVKLSWADFEPAFQVLNQASLTPENVEVWLIDWTRASEALDELNQRLYVARTVNTTDEVAEKGYSNFMENIYPHWMEASQKLKEKLIGSKLEPIGLEVPLRNIRAEIK